MAQWRIILSRPPIKVTEHDDTLYWDTTNDDKHYSYILTMTQLCTDKNDVVSDFREQIEGLRTYCAWNSRGRFIVIMVQRQDCDTEATVEELLT